MSIKKKNICIVSMSYWKQIQGGSEYQLFLLANELIKQGYNVFYIFVDQEVDVKDNNITLIPLRISRLKQRIFYPYQFLLCFDLLGVLQNIKPDVIINRRGNALTGICAYYSKRNACKMIWHIANKPDVIPFRFKWSRSVLFDFIDKKYLEYGIKNADYIIGQAQYQNELLVKNYERTCDLIVPNFHPRPQKIIEKHDLIEIAWIANIKVVKNPEVFLDLAKELESLENVKFIMIGREGNGRYQKKLNLLLKSIKNIEYKGELSQEEVNKLLSKTHIFVNTSAFEGFPNTFIQAWMRKVPVVSLNVDPDNVIKKNILGFHSQTFEQMVKDVQRLISDEKLRNEIGERAQKYAFENHSIEKNVQKYIEVIEQ